MSQRIVIDQVRPLFRVSRSRPILVATGEFRLMSPDLEGCGLVEIGISSCRGLGMLSDYQIHLIMDVGGSVKISPQRRGAHEHFCLADGTDTEAACRMLKAWHYAWDTLHQYSYSMNDCRHKVAKQCVHSSDIVCVRLKATQFVTSPLACFSKACYLEESTISQSSIIHHPSSIISSPGSMPSPCRAFSCPNHLGYLGRRVRDHLSTGQDHVSIPRPRLSSSVGIAGGSILCTRRSQCGVVCLGLLCV